MDRRSPLIIHTVTFMAQQDYYSDGAPEEAPVQEAESTESDSQTAVLPKGVLGGKEFKPGEEVVLQVVKVNEDSVVVKYASESPEEHAEESEPEPQPAQAPMAGGMNSVYD